MIYSIHPCSPKVSQTLALNAWINISWMDELRRWDPRDHGGVDVIHPAPKDTWIPKFILSNGVGGREQFSDTKMPPFILSSGRTDWGPGATMTTACDGMDFTNFPFDTQVCELRFVFHAFTKEIQFEQPTDVGYDGFITTNGEWDIIGSTMSTKLREYDYEFAYFSITLTIKRRPELFIMNILIPIQCLSFLSSFVFVLPEDGGERASFSTTMLLSLSMFMSSIFEQLPNKSDKIPLMVLFIFCLTLLSFFSVMISAVHLRILKERSNNDRCDIVNDEEEQDKPDAEGLVCVKQTVYSKCYHFLQKTNRTLFIMHVTLFLFINIYFCIRMTYNI